VRGIRRNRARHDVAFYVPAIGPLLTHAAGVPPGGAETQIYLLARALARRGTNVCLIVFEVPGAAIPSSVGEVAISLRPPYRTHQRFGKIRETISLGRAVLEVDADVVVSRGATPDIGLAGLFTKASGQRFVYSSANVSDFEYFGLSPKRRNQALFRLGVRLADEVVVQTTEQIHLCKERFGRSPVLIRSIAEPASQRSHAPEAFLWIGRLVWYKRPHAFVELARALPQARFWMVGVPAIHGRESPDLVRAVERGAATTPNLELLSPRPRRELMDLVDRAVAVVNTADFEGMPNIFLEGWSRGVPALALTHDPDGVIERHRLGSFANGSSEHLVELARSLWEERSDQAGVAARCREYILEYHSPETVSAQWVEALGIASPAAAGRVESTR
jgi:glycosyltransferase involved in cell wall biosynthesis